MAEVDDLDSPGTRFQWFILENYGSVAKYIERFGFNGSQVYRTISNASSPRLETCQEYSAMTGINIHWMASGEGLWWAPNDVGRELAKKKGIVVANDDQAEDSIDYAALVHAVFEIGEQSVLEQLANLHDLGKGSSPFQSTSKKTGTNQSKRSKK